MLSTKESLQLINPYNGTQLTQVNYTNAKQLNDKINNAQQAFEVWRDVPVAERCAQVKQGLTYFQDNADVIARDISLQMGKPITQSLGEINGFFERAEYLLSIAETALAPDILPEKKGFVRRIQHEPLGIVFNIAAWNYPLLIPANVIIPALLAGNVVLLKHSAKTPLCGEAFEKAFGQLATQNLVSNLIIDHNTTGELIADPRINYVAFTGSVSGGKKIANDVGRRFIDVGLELGGKDPAYVAEDADLDYAVTSIVDGACYNAGQSCCGVERVYVHQRHYQAFIEKAEKLMDDYHLGDPLLETTTLGPMASRNALGFLQGQVEDALQAGAKLVMGGRPEKNFFLPTLLIDVPQQSSVMQEESFGPILPVHKISSDEDALAKMQDSAYGLTASIWTHDDDRAEHFANKLQAGTIFQNRCDYLDPALPWTGYGDSGKGSTLSSYGFWHLTKRKSIHFKKDI